MTTENIEEKKFILSKEELIKYHNRLLEHSNVKLFEKCIEGQRILEEAAEIRKLVEQAEEQVNKEDSVGEDDEKRTNSL